jgi:hypothetical protein
MLEDSFVADSISLSVKIFTPHSIAHPMRQGVNYSIIDGQRNLFY